MKHEYSGGKCIHCGYGVGYIAHHGVTECGHKSMRSDQASANVSQAVNNGYAVTSFALGIAEPVNQVPQNNNQPPKQFLDEYGFLIGFAAIVALVIYLAAHAPPSSFEPYPGEDMTDDAARGMID